MTASPLKRGNEDGAVGRRLYLVQGEFQVSTDPDVILTTTLGSCVACCMRDPVALAGGMNHFLLPHGQDVEGPDALRYGAHAMELLINGLLHAGAKKSRLQAKLFGGGRLSEHLPDVGGGNVAFAKSFLAYEGIQYLGGSTLGHGARRVQYWPVSGRARQLSIVEHEDDVFKSEQSGHRPVRDTGSVELFD